MDKILIIIFWLIISFAGSNLKEKSKKSNTKKSSKNTFFDFGVSEGQNDNGDLLNLFNDFISFDDKNQAEHIENLKKKYRENKKAHDKYKKSKSRNKAFQNKNHLSSESSLFSSKTYTETEAERIKKENINKRLHHIEEERKRARSGFDPLADYRGESFANLKADYLEDEGIKDNLEMTHTKTAEDFYLKNQEIEDFANKEIKKYIIAAEILGKPKSKRNGRII